MRADPPCGPGPECPVTRAVSALGGKWKLHIVFHLMPGTKRFSELRRAIPDVTQQMLTAQLRELEAGGIVTRTVYPVVPPKVEYSLTPLGAKLRSVTDALEIWGRDLPAVPRQQGDKLQAA
ncbi:HxlR family transcriptional regulator [Devosia sp. Root413D1]|uniref:winged helix-turn-helix transcriptional regulator n=1 Tax=Devosia sp. Root413D1 TaxID=1736531 RepID=UPI00070153C4|nr:helix-turn-helix domain-containing protein [Devosia sp. Root413D1]KQW79418.1 HxlR family transcriptional regulator [Devosia sp. Root413D1]